MKLEVKNPAGRVTNAFFEINKDCLSLFINTSIKGLRPCFYGYCSDGDTFEVGYHYRKKCDEVILYPENKKEIEMLRRPNFELHNKNEMWIIFPNPKIYKNHKE